MDQNDSVITAGNLNNSIIDDIRKSVSNRKPIDIEDMVSELGYDDYEPESPNFLKQENMIVDE